MKDLSSGYPMISANNWWTVRNKFKASLPNNVTANYLVSLLGLKDENSARSNVLYPLKRLGLLDEKGNPTDLAKRWRLDTDYKSACDEILRNVYPAELLDLVPESNFDKQIANNWFMAQGVGQAAAAKMTSLLSILKNGDVSSEEKGSTRRNPSKDTRAKKAASPSAKDSKKDSRKASDETSRNSAEPRLDQSPNLHIDLQIHISPESSPAQIEAIFSSMAKHLYGNESLS